MDARAGGQFQRFASGSCGTVFDRPLVNSGASPARTNMRAMRRRAKSKRAERSSRHGPLTRADVALRDGSIVLRARQTGLFAWRLDGAPTACPLGFRPAAPLGVASGSTLQNGRREGPCTRRAACVTHDNRLILFAYKRHGSIPRRVRRRKSFMPERRRRRSIYAISARSSSA